MVLFGLPDKYDKGDQLVQSVHQDNMYIGGFCSALVLLMVGGIIDGARSCADNTKHYQSVVLCVSELRDSKQKSTSVVCVRPWRLQGELDLYMSRACCMWSQTHNS